MQFESNHWIQKDAGITASAAEDFAIMNDEATMCAAIERHSDAVGWCF
jgi:hypothetical protein